MKPTQYLGKRETQAALDKTHWGCGPTALEESVEAIKARAPTACAPHHLYLFSCLTAAAAHWRAF